MEAMVRRSVLVSSLLFGCAPPSPPPAAIPEPATLADAEPAPESTALEPSEASEPAEEAARRKLQPPPQPPPIKIGVAPPFVPDGALATCTLGTEPGFAVALVLDRSGSMSGERIEQLRKGAERAAKALSPDHRLSIIAFDSQPHIVLPLAEVGDGTAVTEAVARIQPGGGTEGYPAIEAAYEQLRQIPTKRRHIVFLTDGMMPTNGVRDLVSHIARCGITLSSLSLGPDADGELLTMIATVGKGRFVEVADPKKLGAELTAELTASKP